MARGCDDRALRDPFVILTWSLHDPYGILTGSLRDRHSRVRHSRDRHSRDRHSLDHLLRAVTGGRAGLFRRAGTVVPVALRRSRPCPPSIVFKPSPEWSGLFFMLKMWSLFSLFLTCFLPFLGRKISQISDLRSRPCPPSIVFKPSPEWSGLIFMHKNVIHFFAFSGLFSPSFRAKFK